MTFHGKNLTRNIWLHINFKIWSESTDKTLECQLIIIALLTKLSSYLGFISGINV